VDDLFLRAHGEITNEELKEECGLTQSSLDEHPSIVAL